MQEGVREGGGWVEASRPLQSQLGLFQSWFFCSCPELGFFKSRRQSWFYGGSAEFVIPSSGVCRTRFHMAERSFRFKRAKQLSGHMASGALMLYHFRTSNFIKFMGSSFCCALSLFLSVFG